MNKIGYPGFLFNKYTIMVEWKEDLLYKIDRFSIKQNQCQKSEEHNNVEIKNNLNFSTNASKKGNYEITATLKKEQNF